MRYISLVSRMSVTLKSSGLIEEDRPEFCDKCGLMWNSMWCCPTGDPEGPQTPQTPDRYVPDCPLIPTTPHKATSNTPIKQYLADCLNVLSLKFICPCFHCFKG